MAQVLCSNCAKYPVDNVPKSKSCIYCKARRGRQRKFRKLALNINRHKNQGLKCEAPNCPIPQKVLVHDIDFDADHIKEVHSFPITSSVAQINDVNTNAMVLCKICHARKTAGLSI